jgi:hypothetical protein
MIISEFLPVLEALLEPDPPIVEGGRRDRYKEIADASPSW